MKVLHILNSLKASGAEAMLRVAAPVWQARGIDAEILSVGQTTGPYTEALKSAGYPIHHLPFSKSVGFFRSLYQLISAGNYDVVHIHTERGNFYYALTARLAGARQIVRTLHGVFEFSGFAGLVRTCQRQLLGLMGCQQISVSQSVAKNELDRFANQTTHIANWYDATHFTPPTTAQRADARNRLAIANEKFVVVSVGHCSAIKNHAELLKAVAIVEDEIVYLHVGDEGNCNERQIASQLGIIDRTRFVGPTDDVRSSLYAADVFIMPSLHEGCGIAAIEAMACGLPVILSDVKGLKDFREMSRQIILTGTDASEIAVTLRKAMSLKPEERSAIGSRLSDAVRTRFNPERGAAAYARVYRRELKSISHAGEQNSQGLACR